MTGEYTTAISGGFPRATILTLAVYSSSIFVFVTYSSRIGITTSTAGRGTTSKFPTESNAETALLYAFNHCILSDHFFI
eukprot:snap_masked-scaffold_34-processed-gene-0.50-mRNA-1 protein AED:1.00 eAED:1.00 QI:0/0/0/0/1/1/2/0/78